MGYMCISIQEIPILQFSADHVLFVSCVRVVSLFVFSICRVSTFVLFALFPHSYCCSRYVVVLQTKTKYKMCRD